VPTFRVLSDGWQGTDGPVALCKTGIPYTRRQAIFWLGFGIVPSVILTKLQFGIQNTNESDASPHGP